jgi:hypothetical protein
MQYSKDWTSTAMYCKVLRYCAVQHRQYAARALLARPRELRARHQISAYERATTARTARKSVSQTLVPQTEDHPLIGYAKYCNLQLTAYSWHCRLWLLHTQSTANLPHFEHGALHIIMCGKVLQNLQRLHFPRASARMVPEI